MPDITKSLEKYTKKWVNMDKSRKIRIILSVGLVLISVLIAIFFLAHPNYKTVVSGRTTAEIGEMSSALAEAGIIHKIGNGNTAILVKANDQDNAQIALAQSGYMGDNVKFADSLDLISFTTTESDKQKIYKEYYESKIAVKLKKMDSIQEAVVNLSIPEKEVFIDKEERDKPTASVMIKPKGNLTEAQLSGIASLVASSVEGMVATDVTIVDNTGAILNSFEDTSSVIGLSKTNMQIQAEKKKEIETQVVQLLADMTDSVKVGANIVCDFNQEKKSTVTYTTPIEDSDKGLLRSQELNSESLENPDSATTVGTDANQGVGATTVAGAGGTYEKEGSISNYELNQVNKDEVKGLGNIDAVASSITVNLLYGNKFLESPLRSDEEVDTITKMVSMATGINYDRITVTSFKVAKEAEVIEETGSFNWLFLLENNIPYIAAVLIILIVVIFIIMTKNSFKRDETDFIDLGRKIDYTVTDEGDELQAIKEIENSEVKNHINDFVDKQPDIAAGMLKNWIYENDKQV